MKQHTIALGLTLILIAAGGLVLYYYTLPTYSQAAPVITNSVKIISNQAGYAVDFNGSVYQIAAKGANAPSFPCPVGTDPSMCKVLRATCGNGVGAAQEPWKNCANCAFDAGCTGQESCDPYTHQCSVLVGACQVAVYGGQ